MISIAQNKAFFTRDIELQKEEVENLKLYVEYLIMIKRQYISSNDEQSANALYCLASGATAIEKELCMLIKLKENDMAGAWNDLIDAQTITGNVIRNHFNSLTGYLERLRNYETTIFPNMMFGSWGGVIKHSECSICRENYFNCDHMKGKLYMGELCYQIIHKIELDEVSMVDHPADKRCRVEYITDGQGNKRNLLTLEVIRT